MSQDPRPPLAPAQIDLLLSRVRAELGEANQRRLDALAPLFHHDGKARISDCLAAAFPKKAAAEALEAFREFRSWFHHAAKKAGVEVEFAVDTRKAGPEARECWFEGEIMSSGPLSEMAAASIAPLNRAEFAETNISNQALARSVDEADDGMARKTVRYFVSYARSDKDLMTRLLALLREQFGPSRKYRHEVWGDWEIPVGTGWHDRIMREIDRCDFGLLLVSPNFLDSDFIKSQELPRLAQGPKPAIPVSLLTINLARHDLLGLEHSQVFWFGDRELSFADLRDPQRQRRFAEQLFDEIEKRLDEYFGGSGSDPSGPAGTLPRFPPAEPEGSDNLVARLEKHARIVADDLEAGSYVPPRTHLTGLRSLEIEKVAERSYEPPLDAVETLCDWARDPEASPFRAVLGEFGIGKTTTLRRLTRRLNELHEEDPKSPQPIFVDLRSVARGEGRTRVPDLDEIVAAGIRQNWHDTDGPALTPAEILDAVRSRGAVIIFDGLDEKIVHLMPTEAVAFIHELWRALPPSELVGDRRLAVKSGKRRGKLIISCRSHYFKTVWEQNGMLTGEDREGVRASDYQALLLLPFNDEQVRQYLRGVLRRAGEKVTEEELARRAEDAIQLIGSVHNLRELAGRPYLLSVIADHLGELERRKMCGETVLGVTLYEIVVNRTLARDSIKHQFSAEDKLTLMERIAADMFADGAREWKWSKVQEWLDAYLAARPALALRLAEKQRQVLYEDFRTATFVVRPDDSRESFRFAHSSLQEYFHARRLVGALDSGETEPWAIALPSQETLDFVGQILSTDGSLRRLRGLGSLLCIGGDAALVALKYWLLAVRRDYPEPEPLGPVKLAGLNLAGWRICGKAREVPLPLGDAVFSRAKLTDARFESVHLGGADFSDANCVRAEFFDVNLSRARLDNADFSGAILRECVAENLCGAGARWHEAEWSRCDVRGANLGVNFARAGALALCRTGFGNDRGLPENLDSPLEVVTRLGHSSPVQAMGWSPDGRRLASGADDGTVRVWDTESGKCLRALIHAHEVKAVTWSPDARLASGAKDGSIRIWNAESGKCLHTVAGHKSSVTCMAWSPDGRWLASSSLDKTVRVWDAEAGECLRTFAAHEDEVTTVAWSPDGRRLASGSRDKTVRVWDAGSGSSLLRLFARKGLNVLASHEAEVTAVVWSPDGRRLASGAIDNTMRVWDAENGECLRTLAGHKSSITHMAWSRDGRQLASGASDDSVRVWDPDSGKCLTDLRGSIGCTTAVAWSPYGRLLASGADDNSVWVRDPETGEHHSLRNYNDFFDCKVAWSPDGHHLAAGTDDGTVRIWDGKSGKYLRTFVGHEGNVTAMAWSPDGGQFASGSDDDTVRVWDAETGKCLRTLGPHNKLVNAVAWSPDGRRLASGCADGLLRVWNIGTGKCLGVLTGPDFQVNAVTWSPDGRWLASGSADATLRIWDAKSGKRVRALKGHEGAIEAVAWSPDGRLLASGSEDNTVRVWETGTESCLAVLRGHRGAVTAVAWSLDARRISSGGHDNLVRVWDVETWNCLHALQGHDRGIPALAWSPDGRRLASGGADNAVRVWDTETGKCDWLLASFPFDEFASLSLAENKFLWVSAGAWRHLGWRVLDAEAEGWHAGERGRTRILPAEFCGPLPG